MAEPWTYAGEVPMLGTVGTITLVEGSAFAISGRSGDMAPNLPHGFFFRDTRFLSRLELRVNGQAPEALEAEPLDPFSATFALRTRPRACPRSSRTRRSSRAPCAASPSTTPRLGPGWPSGAARSPQSTPTTPT